MHSLVIVSKSLTLGYPPFRNIQPTLFVLDSIREAGKASSTRMITLVEGV